MLDEKRKEYQRLLRLSEMLDEKLIALSPSLNVVDFFDKNNDMDRTASLDTKVVDVEVEKRTIIMNCLALCHEHMLGNQRYTACLSHARSSMIEGIDNSHLLGRFLVKRHGKHCKRRSK